MDHGQSIAHRRAAEPTCKAPKAEAEERCRPSWEQAGNTGEQRNEAESGASGRKQANGSQRGDELGRMFFALAGTCQRMLETLWAVNTG